MPLHPITLTAIFECLHIDYMSIEMMIEPNKPPNVMNIIIF